MQCNYAYKYKGTIDEFRNHFFRAIEKFNEDHLDRVSPIVGKINEDTIEIEIERKKQSGQSLFISPIRSKNGELRFEGVLKSNTNRPFILSLLNLLFMMLLLPLKIIIWLVKKTFNLSITISVYSKLNILMVDYLGCETSLLLETENQIEEIKRYLSYNQKFTGVVDVVSKSCLSIWFNEYLELDIYFENQYHEAYVEINNGLTHSHPMNDEVLEEIINIVEGKIFFVQPRGLIKCFDLKIVDKEKEISKYIGKENIRIYNNHIVQRSKN